LNSDSGAQLGGRKEGRKKKVGWGKKERKLRRRWEGDNICYTLYKKEEEGLSE
jgi:hypothetical protein